MARRMSCNMTIQPVRNRIKTVTRRHVDTWRTLQVGDLLTLIEKGMGLAKGEKQVVLAEVLVVSVVVEPLLAVTAAEVWKEGLWPEAVAAGPAIEADRWFRRFWGDAHGYRGLTMCQLNEVECRRIEWSYETND